MQCEKHTFFITINIVFTMLSVLLNILIPLQFDRTTKLTESEATKGKWKDGDIILNGGS